MEPQNSDDSLNLMNSPYDLFNRVVQKHGLYQQKDNFLD